MPKNSEIKVGDWVELVDIFPGAKFKVLKMNGQFGVKLMQVAGDFVGGPDPWDCNISHCTKDAFMSAAMAAITNSETTKKRRK